MFKRPNAFYSFLVSVPPIIFFGIFVLTFGLFDLLCRKFTLKHGHWGPFSTWTKVTWSRLALKMNGINVRISGPGLEKLKSQRGAIIVSNHQSLLDIPVLFKYCPENLSFVAKRELSYIPIFGWGAYVVGTIFIDRSRGAQNESLQKVSEYLKSGINVGIFPEGTRSASGELGVFKRGAFVFAIQAGVPVIPITILNSRERLPKHEFGVSPGEIEVIVDEPVPTTGLTTDDRQVLSEKIHKTISNRLKARLN